MHDLIFRTTCPKCGKTKILSEDIQGDVKEFRKSQINNCTGKEQSTIPAFPSKDDTGRHKGKVR